MGQTSPALVVDGWMNSPGHCTNIMNAGFTELGVGYYQGDGSWFSSPLLDPELRFTGRRLVVAPRAAQ